MASDQELLQRTFQVETILASKRRGGKDLYYIKWVGFPPSENTWETEADLIADGLGDDLRKFCSSSDGKARKVKAEVHIAKPGLLSPSGKTDAKVRAAQRKEEARLEQVNAKRLAKHAKAAEHLRGLAIPEGTFSTSNRVPP